MFVSTAPSRMSLSRSSEVHNDSEYSCKTHGLIAAGLFHGLNGSGFAPGREPLRMVRFHRRPSLEGGPHMKKSLCIFLSLYLGDDFIVLVDKTK